MRVANEDGDHVNDFMDDGKEQECEDCEELYPINLKACPNCQLTDWMDDPVKVDQMMSHFLQGIASVELAVLLVELTSVPMSLSLTMEGKKSKELMRYVKLARELRKLMREEFNDWIRNSGVPYYASAETGNVLNKELNAEIGERAKTHSKEYIEKNNIEWPNHLRWSPYEG